MRKVLLLLLGLIIIGVSTSLCFINKAPSIRDDLISQTESIYKVKNIRGLKVELKGQNLTTQRVLILTGSVSTEQERIDAQTLAENIKGVIGVENQIIIKEKEKEKISLKIEKKQSASSETIVTPKTVVVAVEPTPLPTDLIEKVVVFIEPTALITELTSLPTELTKKINAIQEIVEEKTIPVIEVPVLVELMPQQPSVPNITNVIKVPIAIQKMVDVPIPVQAISPPVAIKVKEINSSVKLNIKGVE